MTLPDGPLLPDSPLKDAMHRPLRDSPAPVLGALLRAFDRALRALGLRRHAEGLSLGAARGSWLDRWADTYAYARAPGESDEALRGRLQTQTLLGRMVTTEGAILASITAATGLRLRLRPARPRVAMFDDLETALPGDHMLDYGVVDGDNVVYDHLPDAVGGSRIRGPWRPGWGPDGLVIDVGRPYDPQLERSILQAILDQLPAMTGFDLAWSKDLTVGWRDTLAIADGGHVDWDGWSEDVWGESPWGGEVDTLNARGFGIEPWGRNWGSRRLIRVEP